jgi:hypothetical protein
VTFLDAYRRANGNQTRSAVLHLAIFVFCGIQLSSSYEAAWSEWAQTAETREWGALEGLTEPRDQEQIGGGSCVRVVSG